MDKAARAAPSRAQHGSRDRPPLSRNVKILGAVSLAQDTGSELLYPLLPTFVTGVLGAPVAALGLAEGLADAVAAGTKLVAGRLAAPGRRRSWIGAGYGLAALGKLAVAVAGVWPLVLAGRVLDRLGKGVRSVPRDALIAAETGSALRGGAFGFHRAMDTAGAVLGPLLGLGLLQLFDGRIRPALAVAVVPAVISIWLVSLVREQPAPRAELETARTARPTLPRAFWRALAPLAVFALVNSTDALLLQRAAELGLGTTSVVAVYVIYNLVYSLAAYPAGLVADLVPARLVMAAGLMVFAVVYVGLGRVTSPAAVWLLLPLYGLFPAFTDGVSRAWISELVDDAGRTWALGVHGAVTGAGALSAGLWSGLAWGGDGRLPITISGAAALAVASWLIIGSWSR